MQFIETIKIENAQALNLSYHQRRLWATQQKHWDNYLPIDLEKILADIHIPKRHCYKFRLLYTQYAYTWQSEIYIPKKIQKLKMIDAKLDYSYKYAQRFVLDKLRQIAQQQGYDEVLILKNDFVTDTSYTNIAFYDGENWFTPHTFLLNGTQRQFLLDKKIIQEKSISSKNIPEYKKFLLYNSMLGFCPENAQSTENIF